ncbi:MULTISPECIES: phage GP46 family protein [unclassified Fibrobacter]|uniref:phage GP46 family protein n=1 Tax=unclassified Fibrobacter TaxID=2634177 RepID=UPI000C7111D1|nr:MULTISPECIES: phage GP46 family protein [unclassified Fibrobacter]PWJ70158.1 phage protein Gp46 [Fibrobacter sp. UWR4]PZW73507.1 phage protein Gp46 [Fibrobacter sp. UWR1]
MTFEDIKQEVELSLTVAKGSFFKKPEFGHRFKELLKAVASENTRIRAVKYAEEALQWLLDIKHLKSVEAFASYDSADRLLINVECVAYTGKTITFSRFVEVGNVRNS